MSQFVSPKRSSSMTHTLGRIGTVLLLTTALSACNFLSRLSDVGEPPEVTQIKNPTHAPDYQPISMPMPAPNVAKRNANSLWRPGSRAFLKDLRANQVGDIVTVAIDIDDTADIDNATNRSRTTSEDVDVPGLAGYEESLDAIFPEAVSSTDFLNFGGATTQNGAGDILRSETITVNVAAVVTQVLPNGNMVIHGRQETRVNFETRELQIAGIIRPQDIDSSNEVSYEKIAEARLSYGGRGHITDVQQPRYGSQIIDVIMPF